MTDLAAFLTARLGEDEAAARVAAQVAGPDWAWRTVVTLDDETTDYVTGASGTVLMDTMGGIESDAPHVARHDPARVLRDVEAKRGILAAYERQFVERKSHPGDLAGSGALLALHGAVKTLAAVYSGHPDYDPEWAPP